MKKNAENIFLIIFLILQGFLFGVMIVFAITLTNSASVSSRDILNRHAVKVSEQYMRERVDNIISLIEQESQKALEGIESLGDTICQNFYQQDEEELEEFLESWVPRMELMQYGKLLQLILYDRKTGNYTFYYGNGTEQMTSELNSAQIYDYLKYAPYSKKVEYSQKILYVIASQASIDKNVQENIYKIIHATKYGKDDYVWVNEIINYAGGENYAIRRIHSSLISTEGQYLSTDMQDVAGNYPYLDELEKIVEEKEVFQTLYYKDRKDDEIKEKVSYAKLYKPFNWIIATGTPLDDVLLYGSALDKENQQALDRTLTYTILILIIIFFADIFLIIFNNKKMREKVYLEEKIFNNEKIIKQADYEVMTGLLRRGVGEYKIKEFLKTTDNKNGILIVVDLDDLKGINDNLGHMVGDEAIISMANVLKASFRQTDILMRYGGDEFVVFLPEGNNPYEEVEERIDKLVKDIASIWVGKNKEKNIHCSVGYAKVEPEDTFDSLFSRADKALYYVKRNGKNNFACYSHELEIE